jgi:hypothetical protein
MSWIPQRAGATPVKSPTQQNASRRLRVSAGRLTVQAEGVTLQVLMAEISTKTGIGVSLKACYEFKHLNYLNF